MLGIDCPGLRSCVLEVGASGLGISVSDAVTEGRYVSV